MVLYGLGFPDKLLDCAGEGTKDSQEKQFELITYSYYCNFSATFDHQKTALHCSVIQ